VVATTGLLVLGGVVTTFRVGMADPVWPTSPWYLFVISWQEPSTGFLIEHSHRLAGYVVGCCVIVLAVGLWITKRPRLRWLGLAALLGVSAQGLLGGFRVKLNAILGTDLAAIHGCFAQVVFSLLVGIALLTAPRAEVEEFTSHKRTRFRRLGMTLTALVFLQLVWGALVRHTNGALAQRLHVLTAFAVVVAAAWFVKGVAESPDARRHFGKAAVILAGLLLVQVLLGIEAWFGKFGSGVLPELQKLTARQAVVRTGHMLIGSWILATAVVLTLKTYLPARSVLPQEMAPASQAIYLPGTAVVAPPPVSVTRQLEGTT
jgi:heme A synthase